MLFKAQQTIPETWLTLNRRNALAEQKKLYGPPKTRFFYMAFSLDKRSIKMEVMERKNQLISFPHYSNWILLTINDEEQLHQLFVLPRFCFTTEK